jgi:non-specific serine/threonine protein kinase/serine/threonine-protein kinase
VTQHAHRAGSEPPTRVAGRYELGPVLGRGGMGEVRAATDVRLDREVAVKLLRADLAEIDEVRARFEGEARAAAALAHRNVVAVFDAGEDHGAPFIVMERLPGRTLADELAERALSTAEVYDVAHAVLGALEAAHGAGIVHRDVKPENVLRATDGTWKVADFGIAKSAEAASDITVTGVMIGTPAYVAPERIDGRPATPASDLYATGVVLYEAVARRKPFVGDTSIAVAMSVRAGQAPPLRTVAPDVDPTLERVIERAMATDPARRFASAAQMRRELDAHRPRRHRSGALPGDETQPLEPAPVPQTRALPATPRHPGRRRGMSRRVWLAGAGALLAVLVVVGVVLSQRDSGPSSPTPSTVATPAGQSGATLPPDLQRAIDRLREAVQR